MNGETGNACARTRHRGASGALKESQMGGDGGVDFVVSGSTSRVGHSKQQLNYNLTSLLELDLEG